MTRQNVTEQSQKHGTRAQRPKQQLAAKHRPLKSALSQIDAVQKLLVCVAPVRANNLHSDGNHRKQKQLRMHRIETDRKRSKIKRIEDKKTIYVCRETDDGKFRAFHFPGTWYYVVPLALSEWHQNSTRSTLQMQGQNKVLLGPLGSRNLEGLLASYLLI